MADVLYRPRLADRLLADYAAELPAVMVTGPRAAGKTTSARRVVAETLRLDDPAVAAAVAADPDAALRRAREPLLLDEWQEVPNVLAAVKRAVDDDPHPGRFLLTGSVEADLVSQIWPGTGRVVRVVLHGMNRREIAGDIDRPGILQRLRSGSIGDLASPSTVPDLDGYVDLALVSGFPEAALRLSPRIRDTWLDAYLSSVVTRDVQAFGEVRDPVRLRRYLEVLGLSTAGLPTEATMGQAAQINTRTAAAYDRLLESLYLVDLVPAWSSNRMSRLLKRPKRYVADSALAVAAARIDRDTILRDGDLLGRILDTFVADQIRPELPFLGRQARMHHLRTEGGRQEVDLLLDLGAGQVMAIEVKASSSPGPKDARHLIWLREQLGDRFVAGVVLHSGPQPFELGPDLWALPIWTLWS